MDMIRAERRKMGWSALGLLDPLVEILWPILLHQLAPSVGTEKKIVRRCFIPETERLHGAHSLDGNNQRHLRKGTTHDRTRKTGDERADGGHDERPKGTSVQRPGRPSEPD
nr:hypothetical protein CFP56_32870 [Quercus suber]